AARGTCGNVAADADPDHAGASECNGAGACEAPNGSACAAASQCQSALLALDDALPMSCGVLCKACSNAKTGASNGTCSNVTANTDPDNECSGAQVCDGAGGCTLPDGAACSGNSQCLSNFCVDGVCCDSACVGNCEAFTAY